MQNTLCFIKDFNTFIHDHILYCGREHFCCYCLKDFSTEKILKHIQDCFKIHGKQRIKISKEGQYVKFKFLKEK